ncbi:MAG TPA: TolC family protein [Parapedobacter sp.]|uniref:TolC family protein n=1 Tax=Parapedobacter sp. TaxID=1958893 RepID=UPI002B6B88D8|nr:TolC family protein [Parapedobacter sp.]HWK58156.1 TolC family protein [Parapedobacter sp.]
MKKSFLYTIYFIASCCLVLLAPSRGTAQKLVPIKVAIYHALDNNLQIKQARFQAAMSEEDLKLAKSQFYPTLNADVNGSMRFGRYFDQYTAQLVPSVNTASGGISTDIPIFQGFQRINQILANKTQLAADQSNVEKAKNDLVLSVATTYLEALTNQDLLIAAEQQLKLSQRQLEVANANYEVGNNTLADLSQAKSQVATDELSVTSAQNAYDLSMLNLKQLMEMDPAEDILLEKPDIELVEQTPVVYNAAEIFATALDAQPDIQAAELSTEVAKTNIAIAKGAYYPTLGFGAGYSTSVSSVASRLVGMDANNEPIYERVNFGEQLKENESPYIGLSLRIPIFNRFQTRTSVNKAKINYQYALTNEQLAKNNLNKIIAQAVLDLRAAKTRYYSTETAFTSAKDAFEVINQRYEVGLANSVELFTAQTTMNRAEFDHIQARYELLFRSKVIDFYLGNEINFDN